MPKSNSTTQAFQESLQFEEQEIWKPVRNYEGSYEVSSRGRVRSIDRILSNGQPHHGRILSPSKNKNGYLIVGPSVNGKREPLHIHRLVAQAFLGDCPDGCEVNHLDGEKENNKYTNLEYTTASKNIKHAYRLGLRNEDGENHPSHKLWDHEVIAIRSLKGVVRNRRLSKLFEVSEATISNILSRKTWPHI